MRSNATHLKNSRAVRVINENFMLVVFILMILIFSIIEPRFRTLQNFLVIGRQVAVIAILGFGLTFCITAGEIDFSVGSMTALSGMVAGLIMNQTGMGIWWAAAAAIATGLVCGLLNGLLVTGLRLPSFLVTLGTTSIYSGIATTVTNQKALVLYDETFSQVWGNATFLGIPLLLWWMFAVGAVSYFFYHHAPFGSKVKALGGNRTAALFSGIDTKKVVVKVMTISGFLSGLCGLLMIARMSQARPDIGGDYAMDGIAAVVLGGTAFNGGSGSIPMTAVGALILISITNALTIMGLPTTVQSIINGAIIVVAVAMSNRSKS